MSSSTPWPWMNINLPVKANVPITVFGPTAHIYSAITFHSVTSFDNCSSTIFPIYTYTVTINEEPILVKSLSSPRYYQSYSLPAKNSTNMLKVTVVYNGAPIKNFSPVTRLGLWQ